MSILTGLENILFFGDSLSDNGNLSDLSDVVLSARLLSDDQGYSDRYTNIEDVGDGLMWTDTVPAELGLTAYNFAFGGTLARGSETVAFAFQKRGLEFLLAEGIDLAALDAAVLPATFLDPLPDDLAGAVGATNDISLTGQVTNAIARFQSEPLSGTSAAVFLSGGNDYVAFTRAGDFSDAAVTGFIGQLVGSIVNNAIRADTIGGVDHLVYVTQPSITSAPISELLVAQQVAELVPVLIEQGVAPETAPAVAEAAVREQLAGLDELVAIQNAEVVANLTAYAALTGGATTFTVAEGNRLTNLIQDDLSSFGFELGKTGRILNSGSEPFAFVDANDDGLPDTPGFGPLPFFRTGTDPVTDDPLGYVQLDPAAFGVDDDSLLFYDGFHPSAAAQDIIAALAIGTLGGNITFLGDAADLHFASRNGAIVFAEDGADALYGGSGDQVLFGNLGDDCVFGGSGSDVLVGGGDDDKLAGGSGNDVLSGGDGADKLFGGSGNDVIRLGAGDDRASGGSGNDVFVLDVRSDVTEKNVLRGGSGEDTAFFEVDAGEAASVEALLDDFAPGQSFALTIGASTYKFHSIERVVVGERGALPDVAFEEVDPADFRSPLSLQVAYETALAHIGSDAKETVNVAAQWNVVDPFIDVIV